MANTQKLLNVFRYFIIQVTSFLLTGSTTSTNGQPTATLTNSDVPVTTSSGISSSPEPSNSSSSGGLTTDGRDGLIAAAVVGGVLILLAAITIWLMRRGDLRVVVGNIYELLNERFRRH
jgi:hypothetical protein